MKPYGIDKKFLFNYKNYSLKKGYKNWWEIELKKVIKYRERKLDKIRIESLQE